MQQQQQPSNSNVPSTEVQQPRPPFQQQLQNPPSTTATTNTIRPATGMLNMMPQNPSGQPAAAPIGRPVGGIPHTQRPPFTQQQQQQPAFQQPLNRPQMPPNPNVIPPVKPSSSFPQQQAMGAGSTMMMRPGMYRPQSPPGSQVPSNQGSRKSSLTHTGPPPPGGGIQGSSPHSKLMAHPSLNQQQPIVGMRPAVPSHQSPASSLFTGHMGLPPKPRPGHIAPNMMGSMPNIHSGSSSLQSGGIHPSQSYIQQPPQQIRPPQFQQQPQQQQANLPPSQPQHPVMFTPGDTAVGVGLVPRFGRNLAHADSFGGSAPNLNQLSNVPGQPDMMNNMTNQFGQMGFNNQQNTASSTSAVRNFNILTGPPPINEFEVISPPSPLTIDSSISNSPHAICPSSYKRCTLQAIPQTLNLLNKSKLPLALLLTPYRQLLNEREEDVPVIQPDLIVRCRRCRTYINPWVQFVDQGARWKCNLCYLPNDVPAFFDYDPETRQPVDRLQRPELTHSVVEFIAPQEYMVRPPQPVVFLFLIDVSFPAVQSGMLSAAGKTILDNLHKIPNADTRAKVGFIGVDSALHFFNLNSSLSEPQVLVVPDLDEVFLPLPYDLLVTLSVSRNVIVNFLEKLPSLFRGTQIADNCLGKALQFAHKMISPIGGKIVVLNSLLPNVSEGALKQREDPKLFGTPKESQMLQPFLPFYKNFAVDCSRAQVSIDVFLFGGQYNDVATLSGCAKFTGGAVYYYPGFNASRPEDNLKFIKEFSHFLSRPIGLEAVLRVRASKGIRMMNYHGSFFLRSTDLLALPNVSPDQSYTVEMTIEENLIGPLACFQTALLHTSSSGERRIRVITMALPVTPSLSEVYAKADPFSLASLLAKKGVERSLTSKMEDAREAIQYKLIEILAAYKVNFTTTAQATNVNVPENLKLFPVLILAVLKHASLRQSVSIPTDLRSYMMNLVYSAPVEMLIPSLHPRFYALHMLAGPAGLSDQEGKIVLPPMLNLSSEKLERQGVFLLETGYEIFIWLGKMVASELLQMLFDRPMYDAISTGKTIIPRLQNDFNIRVNNIIESMKETRLTMATTYPHVYVVKEDGDPSMRAWFLSYLVEDRQDPLFSYPQFLGFLKEQLAKA